MTSPHTRSIDVAGVPFAVTTLRDAAASTVARALRDSSTGLAIRLANAYSVVSAQHSKAYASLLRDEGVNFPDGTPVAWVMRRLGGEEAGRVRGPSFFTETLREGRSAGLRHYFYGTDQSVLQRMIAVIERDYPGVVVAGASAPDYQDDPRRLAAQLPDWVDRRSVDIVWVGLGSPKQDFVAQHIASERGLVTAGVGAAFDFVAGTVAEAPAFMQAAGLEWLFRLGTEPRRLWRRYLLGNLEFIRAVLPDLLHRRLAPSAPQLQNVPRSRSE